MYLLEMFGISLVLTLIIELGVSRLMGMRSGRQTVLVILVNILTNPAAVLLCWWGIPQLPVELAVVLAEWLVYYMFSRDEAWGITRPFLLAAVCNGISWGTGILIQMMGG